MIPMSSHYHTLTDIIISILLMLLRYYAIITPFRFFAIISFFFAAAAFDAGWCFRHVTYFFSYAMLSWCCFFIAFAITFSSLMPLFSISLIRHICFQIIDTIDMLRYWSALRHYCHAAAFRLLIIFLSKMLSPLLHTAFVIFWFLFFFHTFCFSLSYCWLLFSYYYCHFRRCRYWCL